MRVLVTGGTGFIGAHSAHALHRAGHDVVLLVRAPRRVASTLAHLGMPGVDHVVGDMTDRAAVAAALDGCEAVLHCAAVVSTRYGAARLAANVTGAEVVVGGAVARGLDPVVYVSSVAALFRPGLAVLRPDLPPVADGGSYGASKAAAERYVRRLQDDGAPVAVTYPAAVAGPAAGTAAGDVAAGIAATLRLGFMPTRDGAWSVIDVRDLARVHAGLMSAGRGPGRYLCGGRYITMVEQAAIYRELTGRRFPVLPLPGAAVRAAGAVMEAVTRVVPLPALLTRERADILTRWMPTDDTALRELGVGLTDPRRTFADAIRSLYGSGRVSAAAAGRLAAGG